MQTWCQGCSDFRAVSRLVLTGTGKSRVTFFRGGTRPYWCGNRGPCWEGLDRGAVLLLLDLADSLKGMRRYAEHLKLNEAQDPEQRETLWKQYCRGCFIGPAQEKQAWAKELEQEHPGG